MVATATNGNGKSTNDAKTPAELRATLTRTVIEAKLVHAECRLLHHQSTRRLLESNLNSDWLGQYQAIFDRYGDGWIPLNPLVTNQERRGGRNFPLYQNENQLALLRTPARILCATNPYAIGCLNGLTSYTLGAGWKYIVGTKDDADDELKAKAQDIIDEFIERTLWDEWCDELFWRSHEDGEYFLRHWLLTSGPNNGKTDVRSVEPEQILKPAQEPEEVYSFGVRTPKDDVQDVEAFWVSDLDNSAAGEEVDVADMVHLKLNVKRSIKRGLTDFCFDTLDTFQTASKLKRNMGEGAAIQAAIAWIRQHESASQQQVQSFKDALVDYQSTDRFTNKTKDHKTYEPGTIIDTGKDSTYAAPPSAANAAQHVAILSACLRGATVRWNAPEWLGSSDASNNNFASALVAESPFARYIGRQQRMCKPRFLATMMIVLKNAEKAGELPSGACERLTVTVEAADVEARDKLQEAQKNQILDMQGVMSKQTWSQREGLDYEQEQKHRQQHAEEYPGTGGLMGGAFGAGDSGGLSDNGPGILDDSQGNEQGGDAGEGGSSTHEELRATVGGSTAIAALQRSYYAGELPREAAIANAVSVFGFSTDEANTLFPQTAPVKLVPDDAGGDVGNGSGGNGGDGNGFDMSQRTNEGIDASGHNHASDGKFGTGGGTGGSASSGGVKSSGIASKAQAVLKKAGKLPAAAVAKAKEVAKKTYTKIEGRYGRKGAIAVLSGAIVLFPLPGSLAISVGIAETYLWASKKMSATEGGGSGDDSGLAGSDLNDAILDFLNDLYSAHGEEVPKELADKLSS